MENETDFIGFRDITVHRPSDLQSQFGALRSVLESGVPTIRNRAGGHGAGVKRREVPRHLASYTLHLTAAAILFLAEAEAAP